MQGETESGFLPAIVNQVKEYWSLLVFGSKFVISIQETICEITEIIVVAFKMCLPPRFVAKAHISKTFNLALKMVVNNCHLVIESDNCLIQRYATPFRFVRENAFFSGYTQFS